jgi:chromosome partitioning protein
MTRVISIANEKGGVAKTTTTLSLAGALVERGYEVLLIDLDPQANLSLSLGTGNNGNDHSMINAILTGLPLPDCVQKTNVEHLSLIPSNSEVSLAERFLPNHTDFEFSVKNKIASLDGSFNFVLIDCPPFLGAITQNALYAADLLILPTQAEYYSIFALKNMMSMIRQVRQKGNPNLKYRLLLTMFDKRNGIHCTLAEHLRSNFSEGVLDTVIEVDTKLRESPIMGLPVTFHASKSRSAMQYRFLAQEIVGYVQEIAQ